MFICDDLDILSVNSVNFGPVTPEFKRVVGVHRVIKNSFETNKLSHDLLDRFLLNVHCMVGI